MTRADDKRFDDILAAAAEIAHIVGRGKNKFDDDVALRRAWDVAWRSSAKLPKPSPT